MRGSPERNNLFPVFIKPGSIQVLIVGGGTAGNEKLHFLLKCSPDVRVRLVSPEISKKIYEKAEKASNISLIKREFLKTDLDDIQLIIVATGNTELNLKIREYAKDKNILINVADTPELCDFYLGSIVTKGDLKIAVSTNGKSPVFAKRFRQFLEEMIPENIQETLDNLNLIRRRIKGDFNHKLQVLHKITSDLASKND